MHAPILAGLRPDYPGLARDLQHSAEFDANPSDSGFPFPNDVGKSQGNSAIGDHNTQYNLTPAFTLIRGKHTIQTGAQFEFGYDNYFQTNIASGAFAFGGNWTTSTGRRIW